MRVSRHTFIGLNISDANFVQLQLPSQLADAAHFGPLLLIQKASNGLPEFWGKVHLWLGFLCVSKNLDDVYRLYKIQEVCDLLPG